MGSGVLVFGATPFSTPPICIVSRGMCRHHHAHKAYEEMGYSFSLTHRKYIDSHDAMFLTQNHITAVEVEHREIKSKKLRVK